MAENRPSIPAEIKREVRKRCGFGCVICGHPIYQYDHMVEWSKTHHHKADELTLLCPNHHGEVTSGLLNRGVVEKYNRHPFNVQQGVSSKYLMRFSGEKFIAKIAGNTFEAEKRDQATFHPILIDGIAIVRFRFEGDIILLTVRLFDKENNLLLEIYDNELYYSIEPWDIEREGTEFIIRIASRDIFVAFEIRPPNEFVITRGNIYLNGIGLKLTENELEIENTNSKWGRSLFCGCYVGLNIGNVPAQYRYGFICSVLDEDRLPYPKEKTLTPKIN